MSYAYSTHIMANAPLAEIRARHKRARVGLIRAREARGLTRPALGRLIGISRFTVFRVEMGETTPQIEVMVNWIEALGPHATLDMFRRPEAG